jgi:hypothetical protein
VFSIWLRGRADSTGVSIIGPPISSSVSGVTPAERAADRGKRIRKDPDGHIREADVADVAAHDAVRGLEGNDQEEAHEDRQAHEHYTPGGFVRNKGADRKLDIEG